MMEYVLHEIKDPQDPLLDLVSQDPVRPHIPAHARVSDTSRVLVLMKDQIAQSVICVAVTADICTQESQLFGHDTSQAQVIMLYTIWSLVPGTGRILVQHLVPYVKQHWPQINKMVTLSPLTSQAEKFHLKNGAKLLQRNSETVNFEYDL